MMSDLEPALSYVEVVRATERRLLRLGVMLTGNEHTAEDLVQTVLARAHRKWARIRSVERPEAYLRTMVVNEFLSWRRLLKNNEVLLGRADRAADPRRPGPPAGAARCGVAVAGQAAAS